MSETPYTDTVPLEKMKLTADQEVMMVKMIKDIQDAPNTLKQTVRWQKWFRRIWDAGKAEGLNELSEVIKEKLSE